MAELAEPFGAKGLLLVVVGTLGCISCRWK